MYYKYGMTGHISAAIDTQTATLDMWITQHWPTGNMLLMKTQPYKKALDETQHISKLKTLLENMIK